MKRILTALLTLTLLLGTLTLSALAFQPPMGASAQTPVELTTSTEVPDLTKNIAKGLTAGPWMSETLLNFESSDWLNASNAVSELKLADLANHLKYGFSVYGITNLERGLCAAVDGVWAVGETGAANTQYFSKSKAQGAASWKPSGKLYNVVGDELPENASDADKAAYPYTSLMTFNFGKVANLESFAYMCPQKTGNGYPQGADVYVSDDGKTWTLVGYYDRTAKRMAGSDYENVAGDLLGADAAGKTMSAEHQFTNFVLPENTKGQFLRVAFTSPLGKTVSGDSLTYDQYVNHATAKVAVREFFVFGTLTDEVKTPWMDPADDPYLNATKTEESSTEEEDLPAPKPAETTKQEEQTTAAPESAATTEAATEQAEEKGGCGAAFGVQPALIAVMLCCLLTLCYRRRKNSHSV